MDPTGKSDPYCVVIVGNQEQRTVVQYSTVCPTWHETLQFEVSGVPQLMQNEPGNNVFSFFLGYVDMGSLKGYILWLFSHFGHKYGIKFGHFGYGFCTSVLNLVFFL